MSSHLRFAGVPDREQRQALETIIRANPLLMQVLADLRALDLPDWQMVSGAIYNSVWNELTGRPQMTGVNDIDVFYFDPGDLSYEAEDKVIRRGNELFAACPVPVEIRNQARVHLWYEAHFGYSIQPLTSCRESIVNFASKTHAVGVRLDARDGLDIYAPYGLEDLFAFRMVPNQINENRRSYDEKAKRAKSVWPEVTIEPW